MIVAQHNHTTIIPPRLDGAVSLSGLVKLLPSLVQQMLFYEVELGYVLRVVPQDQCTSYGEIQCKILFGDEFTTKQTGTRLIPRNPYDIDIPIPGELVLCSWHPDERLDPRNGPNFPQGYYFGILDILNKQNHNALLGSWIPSQKDMQSYDQTQNVEGVYFKSNQQLIPQLPYKEGDKLITGRYGQAIRFTSEYNSDKSVLLPQIKISNDNYNCVVGANQFVTESMKLSGTSLYMTNLDKHTDNLIEISSTRTMLDQLSPFSLTGNTMILNSERVIINAVGRGSGIELYGASYLGLSAAQNIVAQTDGDMLVDATNNIAVSSNNMEISAKSASITVQQQYNIDAQSVNIVGKSINLGDSAIEPLVLGNQLVAILKELCTQCTLISVASFGAVPNNAAAFGIISEKLNTILSTISKTK